MKNQDNKQNQTSTFIHHPFSGMVFTVMLACLFLILGSINVRAEDTDWQKAYDFTLDEENHYIILDKYNGTETEHTVPAKAIEGDVEYTTYLEGSMKSYQSESVYTVVSKEIWKNDTLTTLHFETGVVFGPDMSHMFQSCTNLQSLDLHNIDTSNVTDMGSAFSGCTGLTTIDLSSFDTSKVTSMRAMFSGCTGLTALDVTGFNTSKVTDMEYMFRKCSGLTSLDVSTLDTSNVKTMESLFDNCTGLTSIDVSNFDTSKVTDMTEMFYDCSGLTSIDLANFKTTNLQNMYLMFGGCTKLESIDLSSFDTSNVTSMGQLFEMCSNLKTVNVSSFNTSKVTSMHNMFRLCSKLTELNLSNFDTSQIKSMNIMFGGCSSLKNLDLSNFDTSNVTNMAAAFASCTALETLDISNFNTSKVTDMGMMFSECSSLKSLDVSSFDVQNVTETDKMFQSCTSLKELDLSNFDMSKVTKADDMFKSCTGLNKLNTPKNVTININLPDTFYDTSHTALNALPMDSSASILLVKESSDPTDASTATVTVDDQIYTGSPIMPDVVVKLDGSTIDKEYYDVSYSNNIEVGKATVTVTFKGDYTGEATGQFTINSNSSAEPQKETTPKPQEETTSASKAEPAPSSDSQKESTPEPAPVKKKDITVSGKDGSKYVLAGKKLQLKVTANRPDIQIINVKWKSSNKKWATVSKKGVVKAKKAGRGKKVKITAIITYTVNGMVKTLSLSAGENSSFKGNDLYGEGKYEGSNFILMGASRYLRTTRDFNVYMPKKEIKKILSIRGKSSVGVKRSIKLYAKTDPVGNSDRLNWTSSNSHATVSNGKVRGKSKGWVIITCKPRDGSRAKPKSKRIRVK